MRKKKKQNKFTHIINSFIIIHETHFSFCRQLFAVDCVPLYAPYAYNSGKYRTPNASRECNPGAVCVCVDVSIICGNGTLS